VVNEEGGKEWIEGRTDEWPGNPDRVSRADPTATGCQYSIGRRSRFRLSGRLIIQARIVSRPFFNIKGRHLVAKINASRLVRPLDERRLLMAEKVSIDPFATRITD